MTAATGERGSVFCNTTPVPGIAQSGLLACPACCSAFPTLTRCGFGAVFLRSLLRCRWIAPSKSRQVASGRQGRQGWGLEPQRANTAGPPRALSPGLLPAAWQGRWCQACLFRPPPPGQVEVGPLGLALPLLGEVSAFSPCGGVALNCAPPNMLDVWPDLQAKGVRQLDL